MDRPPLEWFFFLYTMLLTDWNCRHSRIVCNSWTIAMNPSSCTRWRQRRPPSWQNTIMTSHRPMNQPSQSPLPQMQPQTSQRWLGGSKARKPVKHLWNQQEPQNVNHHHHHHHHPWSTISKAKKVKLTLSVNGDSKILVKNRWESIQHVLCKAILWKLFSNEYPNIQIEYDIGDPNYLPDVVSVQEKDHLVISNNNSTNENCNETSMSLLFWGESGRMRIHKAIDLLQRYPDTHIVHCRWGMDIDQFRLPLLEALEEVTEDGERRYDIPSRSQPFTFASLPFDLWRFIDAETGDIHITNEDVKWQDL